MTAIFCSPVELSASVESILIHAGVAKLADALASGASGRKALGVQVPSSALVLNEQVRCREGSKKTLYGSAFLPV